MNIKLTIYSLGVALTAVKLVHAQPTAQPMGGSNITYFTKLGTNPLDFNARWIHDFDVKNAVEGDGFSFVGSLKF